MQQSGELKILVLDCPRAAVCAFPTSVAPAGFLHLDSCPVFQQHACCPPDNHTARHLANGPEGASQRTDLGCSQPEPQCWTRKTRLGNRYGGSKIDGCKCSVWTWGSVRRTQETRCARPTGADGCAVRGKCLEGSENQIPRFGPLTFSQRKTACRPACSPLLQVEITTCHTPVWMVSGHSTA